MYFQFINKNKSNEENFQTTEELFSLSHFIKYG